MPDIDEYGRSINGLETFYSFTLSPEESKIYFERLAALQLEVFGEERLAQDKDNLPSPQEIDSLIWEIERFCTAPGSRSIHGASHRMLQKEGEEGRFSWVEVHWNPAGVVGGFGANTEWDGAIGSIFNFKYQSQWLKPEGFRVPRPFHIQEGLFIDRQTGHPMIKKSIWTDGRNNHGKTATKPATSDEVKQALSLIQTLSNHQLNDGHDNQEKSTKQPVYLEIGYGLDPMAILSRRKFHDRMYVGIDKAIGDYENLIAEYPDAVKIQTQSFLRETSARKQGEHIFFIMGSGENLPLPNDSVHEIFMSNVVNAELNPEAASGILHEARRVIEKGPAYPGTLVLKVNWNRSDWTIDKMVSFLGENGFLVFRSVRGSDVEYERMESQYGTAVQVPAPRGYYLLAHPKSNFT